jgi:hypothetical protein
MNVLYISLSLSTTFFIFDKKQLKKVFLFSTRFSNDKMSVSKEYLSEKNVPIAKEGILKNVN